MSNGWKFFDYDKVKPMWLQNEPEWYSNLMNPLTNSKSYLPSICNKVNELIHTEQMVFHYKKTMSHRNPKKYINMDIKDIRKEFYELTFDRLYNEIAHLKH